MVGRHCVASSKWSLSLLLDAVAPPFPLRWLQTGCRLGRRPKRNVHPVVERLTGDAKTPRHMTLLFAVFHCQDCVGTQLYPLLRAHHVIPVLHRYIPPPGNPIDVGEEIPRDCSVGCWEETVDGAYFSRAGTGCAEKLAPEQSPKPSGRELPPPPTAERSKLSAELRRVVYCGDESGRHESDGLPNERQPLGRRKEAGRPGEKHGKIEQDADEGIPVVTNLKRFDAEGAITLSTRHERHTLDKPPRQNFQPQQCYEKNRYEGPQDRAQRTACPSVPHSRVFHYGYSNRGSGCTCQELPTPLDAGA